MSDKLNKEQCKVFSLYQQGFSFFLTGEGGTGKSFLLKEIVRHARIELSEDEVAVTAPTGLAASHINGQTIQSWAGIGIGNGTSYQLLGRVLANEESLNRWKKCKLLIIDEVSLLNIHLLEKLEFIARQAKGNNIVFGGIQLIFTGDFFQIPPVGEFGRQVVFCFQSPIWRKCIDFSVKLCQVIRQTDPTFMQFLGEIRQGGRLSSTALAHLNELTRPITWSPGEPVVKLFPTREEAESENNRLLSLIPGESHIFISKDGSDVLDKNCPAQKKVFLKKGAIVMLLINCPKYGLVNGSIGVVREFIYGYPQVSFNNGQTLIIREHSWVVDGKDGAIASRRQLPLTLAWAITIHKCQGMTLQKAEISLSNMFVQGQAYTALSRVKTLAGIHVKPGFDQKLPAVSEHVLKFYHDYVVPASTINFSDVQPIRMNPTVEQECDKDGQVPVPPQCPSANKWENIPPLPASVEMKGILKKMLTDELMSDHNRKLLVDIGFEEKVTSKMLSNFICYSWHGIHKFVSATQKDVTLVVTKKNWVGHLRHLHQLKISIDMVSRWTEVLTSSGVSVVNGQLSG